MNSGVSICEIKAPRHTFSKYFVLDKRLSRYKHLKIKTHTKNNNKKNKKQTNKTHIKHVNGVTAIAYRRAVKKYGRRWPYLCFYTPPHDSGGVLSFHYGRPCVCPSVVRPPVRISFPDDNLSKHQWIFTKLGMCIDIVEIWFGIANGQISSNFDGVICPTHAHIFIFGR